MILCSLCHALRESVLNNLVAVAIFDHLKLDLLIERGHEVSSHRILLSVSQKAHIFQCSECVAFEVLQELF